MVQSSVFINGRHPKFDHQVYVMMARFVYLIMAIRFKQWWPEMCISRWLSDLHNDGQRCVSPDNFQVYTVTATGVYLKMTTRFTQWWPGLCISRWLSGLHNDGQGNVTQDDYQVYIHNDGQGLYLKMVYTMMARGMYLKMTIRFT